MFVRGAVDVANFDIAWVGGISEAQRIAHLAATFDRAIAPHDCTGPVTLLANVHLLMTYPNGLIAETVRAHTNGFYADIVTTLPPIHNGLITSDRRARHREPISLQSFLRVPISTGGFRAALRRERDLDATGDLNFRNAARRVRLPHACL